MKISRVGIDIAKNVFHLVGMDKEGHVLIKKRLTRQKLPEFIAQLSSCVIAMESCGGSNYWARKFREMGHEVKLISPQFIKPYLKGQKNDFNDSEAICEAVSRPTMRFVGIKSQEQQDLQCLHRVRSRFVGEKVCLINQIRGFLLEYGITIPQGAPNVQKKLPEILEESGSELSQFIINIFWDLYKELLRLEEKIKDLSQKILQICKQNPLCQELMKIEGVGFLTATAIMSAIGNARDFKNGRQLAAWLGLVPKQHSSGGKQVLLGITKRGDKYLRQLLIHGARAVISRAREHSSWLKGLIQRQGRHKAYVALANKNARRIWATLVQGVYMQHAL